MCLHPFTVTFFAGVMLSTSDNRLACPSLFRIVRALDGGICRIRLPLGRLSSAQARMLAKLAATYGSPEIEATNRANLQIRGVLTDKNDALIAGLIESDLAPKSTEADDVRNVMVSPTLGLDAAAIINISELALRVISRLIDNEKYHVLSPKFSIQIDGGEQIATLTHPSDIWLSAIDQDRFALGLAGTIGENILGIVARSGTEETIFRILDDFIKHIGRKNSTGEIITRMRHLLASESLANLSARLPHLTAPDEAWRRREPIRLGHIGAQCQRDGNFVLGGVPPLGRISEKMMLGLADLADEISAGEIRMTPWQSVMLPHISKHNLEYATLTLQKLGFITQANQTLATTLACAGNVSCAAGLSDTKKDAKALAKILDDDRHPVFGLHLTGCAKSCASPRPTPYTLLGLRPGHYDLFVASNTTKTQFGERLGHDLTLEQAAALLSNRENV